VIVIVAGVGVSDVPVPVNSVTVGNITVKASTLAAEDATHVRIVSNE
jgi:hypothetical protein